MSGERNGYEGGRRCVSRAALVAPAVICCFLSFNIVAAPAFTVDALVPISSPGSSLPVRFKSVTSRTSAGSIRRGTQRRVDALPEMAIWTSNDASRRGTFLEAVVLAHPPRRDRIRRRSAAFDTSPESSEKSRAVDAEISEPRSSSAATMREANPEAGSAAKVGEGDGRAGGARSPSWDERRNAGRRSAGTKDSGGPGRGRGAGRLPLPLFDVESFGLLGRWEEMGGNFLLRPPNGESPRALLHFVGGAFAGAAPHLTYNYLLSGLAEMGYLVVATPYPLGFDHLKVCDGILERFERAAVPLAAEYGALPVVGIGHSLGALLQLLITCLFPDTPRAANALISFNNKPVREAVPGFEELILPLVTQLFKEGGGGTGLFTALEMLRETVDNLVDGYVASGLAPAILETEVVPLIRQLNEILDQLPALILQIADGTREFTPTPEETRDVVSKMYRARRTIMIQFDNDTIDESESMKEVIQEGKTLLRMKRPMVDMELRYEVLAGTHVTPLTQNVFPNSPIDSIDPLYGARQAAKKKFLKTVNQVGQLLVDWLEESASPAPPSSSGMDTAAAAAGAGVSGATG